MFGIFHLTEWWSWPIAIQGLLKSTRWPRVCVRIYVSRPLLISQKIACFFLGQTSCIWGRIWSALNWWELRINKFPGSNSGCHGPWSHWFVQTDVLSASVKAAAYGISMAFICFYVGPQSDLFGSFQHGCEGWKGARSLRHPSCCMCSDSSPDWHCFTPCLRERCSDMKQFADICSPLTVQNS